MRDITQIDFTQRYGKVIKEDVTNQTVFFIQNGIEYDGAGKACNKKQVKAYYAKVAAEAQKTADAAKEAYEAAQAQANTLMAEIVPADPKTVAEYRTALENAGVDVPEDAKKPDLERLWDVHKASVDA